LALAAIGELKGFIEAIEEFTQRYSPNGECQGVPTSQTALAANQASEAKPFEHLCSKGRFEVEAFGDDPGAGTCGLLVQIG
jgi:hypothetical protein